jgi:2-iminoacetate synthase
MKFTPEKYSIPDERMKPFIDPAEIWDYLNRAVPGKEEVRRILDKSLSKQRLNLQEVACLVKVDDPELLSDILEAAKTLKRTIYGNRIVLFAPLYIGNKCSNDCTYCGFRSSNPNAVRKTLSTEVIVSEVEALEEQGQKRLILVFGEHAQYDAGFIADSVRTAYGVKKGPGAIRRVNINAAPLDIEGFATVRQAGIGTFQIFQETYHPEAYQTYHLRGRKADYTYRLTALDRAQEAGIDDVGIGVLFGLYDWRFDVMALVRHTNHLEACYNVGPHTISFPRIKDASMLKMGETYLVGDDDFKKLVAILRLAVPYTGMILTAREPAGLRNEMIQYGVSQIDGGTHIELGGYSETVRNSPDLNRGQFRINDGRSLNEIVDELLDQEMIPSFCTACYRLGRTGEHFMEFSVPGFIKRYCTPNALLTLGEYLLDYAPERTAVKGWHLIHSNLDTMEDHAMKSLLNDKLLQLGAGKRDLFF